MATIYWAIYPSAQADPTASEIKNQTVSNGVFGTDTAPTGDGQFTGTAITGLTASTSYKLAAVWSDGSNDSNVVVSGAWSTLSGIIEAALSFNTSINILPASLTQFESNITYQQQNGFNLNSIKIIESIFDLSTSLSLNLNNIAILETVLILAKQLAENISNISIFETIISFTAQLIENINSNTLLEAALLLNKNLIKTTTGGGILTGTISEELIQNIALTTTRLFDVATILTTTQGLNNNNLANLNAQQEHALLSSSTFSSIALLNSVINYNLEKQLSLQGSTFGDLDALLDFTQIYNINTANSSNILISDLSIEITNAVEAITTAELYSAVVLNKTAAVTVNGGKALEAIIQVAIEQNITSTLDIGIEGIVDLNINTLLQTNTQTVVLANTTLAHQVGLQSIVSALLNAGLNFSNIQSLTLNGTILVVELVLPSCRTLTIQVEDRTLNVAFENRTLNITSCEE